MQMTQTDNETAESLATTRKGDTGSPQREPGSSYWLADQQGDSEDDDFDDDDDDEEADDDEEEDGDDGV